MKKRTNKKINVYVSTKQDGSIYIFFQMQLQSVRVKENKVKNQKKKNLEEVGNVAESEDDRPMGHPAQCMAKLVLHLSKGDWS